MPFGATVRGATSSLALFDPFPDDTSVDISFVTDQGPRSPRALQAFVIPGRSLRAVPEAFLPARAIALHDEV